MATFLNPIRNLNDMNERWNFKDMNNTEILSVLPMNKMCEFYYNFEFLTLFLLILTKGRVIKVIVIVALISLIITIAAFIRSENKELRSRLWKAMLWKKPLMIMEESWSFLTKHRQQHLVRKYWRTSSLLVESSALIRMDDVMVSPHLKCFATLKEMSHELVRSIRITIWRIWQSGEIQQIFWLDFNGKYKTQLSRRLLWFFLKKIVKLLGQYM